MIKYVNASDREKWFAYMEQRGIKRADETREQFLSISEIEFWDRLQASHYRKEVSNV